ncbi:O-antigen ligase family protein [Variovorax soli]|uniref:O-antigen ligase n=1 Tax=Variovorax soli TaxID=376815 RepID=A0ABU1N8G8_9BURK|nr:O-antigen ligase family protein [Variovorax soli]MDR6534739.1 O-antigen ligase [Variovorax soli]
MFSLPYMTHRNFAEGVLAWMIPAFAVVAFSGVITFLRIADPYDFYRKAQIICLSILIAFSAPRLPMVIHGERRSGLWAGAILLALLAICLHGGGWSPFSIADATLYGMLFLGVLSYARLFQRDPQSQDRSALILALAPLLNVWLMFLSTIDLFISGTWNDWQLVFSTIREFDDALLPCLFLLWHRPGGLARARIIPLVWLLSTLYLLALWQDGARSVLLSAIGALLLLGVLRRDAAMLRLPVSSLAVAGALFYAMRWLFDSDHTTRTVFRLTTSYRSNLWDGAVESWIRSPLMGIGGDQFGRHDGLVIAMHPHNIALQWIGEYGLLGTGVVVLVGVFVYRLVRGHRRVPPFCLGALIACVMNSLLSGAFIYPLSQLLIIWTAGWALARYRKHSTSAAAAAAAPGENVATRAPIMLVSAALLTGMWAVHGGDVLSRASSNDSGSTSPPRFWQRGAVLHLDRVDARQ